MEFGDIIWAFLMFIVGLVVFRATFLKQLLNVAGVVLSLFSLYSIATEPDLLVGYFLNIPVSYIAGAVTHYLYLIGANIGRANHFHVDINYGRIILYGVIIIGLIIILNNFDAIVT